MESLNIKNLKVEIDGTEILHGINLEIKPGEVHAIMGPNGSGKSTLAKVLLGHPAYTVTHGDIEIDGESIVEFEPEKRSQKGLFLSMQYPPEITGVSIGSFLRVAKMAQTGKPVRPLEFYKELQEKMTELSIDKQFAHRYLNVGFSGGEKKKAEILQLLILDPKYAILDETDSGLDVDALKIIAAGINKFKNKNNAILLITHYNRILEYIEPDKVHILAQGNIIKTGDKLLAHEIEKDGYKKFIA